MAATVVRLRKEARKLFEVSVAAFKFIRDNPSGHDEEREALLQALREVIDRVDPPIVDESLISIDLPMTNYTLDVLLKVLEDRKGMSDEDGDVFEAVKSGARRTKQRAFVKLDINPAVLRRLRYVLMHTKTEYQDRPFKRLAKLIEEQGMSKNPMEVIARMGL
jgi:hypothetical protein